MSFCEKCGNKVLEDTNFCASCGKNLKEETNTLLKSESDNTADKTIIESSQKIDIVEKENSNSQTKQTPSYAGFWERFAASVIDGFISFLITLIIMIPSILAILLAGVDLEYLEVLAEVIYYIIGIPLSWLYYAIFESSSFQGTPGKMILGIKVVNLNKEPISFMQASGRYFGKMLSVIICYIGFIMAAFTDRKQGLHDVMAGTLIIKK